MNFVLVLNKSHITIVLQFLSIIFNLQNYYHPVAVICARALLQAKKGQQMVHTLEKTIVLYQSISVISVCLTLFLHGAILQLS